MLLLFICLWITTGLFAQSEFITTWKTDNGGNPSQITIPTFPSPPFGSPVVYDYTVDWGDGESNTNVTSSITHTYDQAGTYQVTITGVFPRIYFNNTGDKLKLLEINQWGNIAWESMEDAFYGCSNLQITASDIPDLANVQNMSYMFANASSLTGTESMNNWDVSNVTSMRFTFFDADAFNQDIGNWDISSVQDMAEMFRNMTLPVSTYNAILIGWGTDSSGAAGDDNDDIPSNIRFNGGTSQYCGEAISAKQNLTSNYSWNISDLGQATDNENPTTVCKNIAIWLDDGGAATIAVSDIDNGSSDACGIASIVLDKTTFAEADLGVNNVELTVTDISGNIASCTAQVIVSRQNAPLITLVGDNPQIIALGDGYTELGATTQDGSTVVINTSDFADALGTYTIRYNATSTGGVAANEVTRTVQVVDRTPPVITLLGDNPMTVELGTDYVDPGATAMDNVDGNISVDDVIVDSSSVDTDMLGSYTVTYNVADAAGNEATQVTRTVQVVDTTAPVITLSGSNPQILELNEGYAELGATTDDGSQVTVDASEFQNVVGDHTIYYDATDASNNTADQVTRTVRVIDPTDITAFSFSEQLEAATIDGVNHTVALDVANGTDPGNLVATFTVSDGASVTVDDTDQESGVTPNDFTNPVDYKVISPKGYAEQVWKVTVTESPRPFVYITPGTTTEPFEFVEGNVSHHHHLFYQCQWL